MLRSVGSAEAVLGPRSVKARYVTVILCLVFGNMLRCRAVTSQFTFVFLPCYVNAVMNRRVP